ncbi:MAG: cellulose-binding protein [Chloroflexi bacterium]|nr:cellulose-binding protein [Chloroflexota bacterium]
MKNRSRLLIITLPFLLVALLGLLPNHALASLEDLPSRWIRNPFSGPPFQERHPNNLENGFLEQTPSVVASTNLTSPLGTNLWFFHNWVSEYSMVDAFKQSQPWIPQCQPPDCAPGIWDTHEAASLDLDPYGWVRTLPSPTDPPTFTSVATQMFNGFGAHYPAGQYIVLYEGAGTIVYGGDAVKNVALSTPGRDVLDVTPYGGILLRITSTDPSHTGDYVRNIRVIMPGFESNYATQIFHPDFLDKIGRYRVLRPMQWAEINGSTQSSWAARTKIEDARWHLHGGGVPIEILIALANRTSSDLWFNPPHMADDDYITQSATLMRNTLAPNLKVYVEYSNEVWNGAYDYNQSYWVQGQGLSMWPSAAAFTAQMNWHGMRTAQMCDIWKAVWGAQSNRVVCVMGAQSGSAWTASQALDCPLWTAGAPCYAHGISSVAIGPYFAGYIGNSQYVTNVVSWTQDPDGGLNKLFTEIITGGVLPGGPAGGALARAFSEIDGHVAVANARGLSVVAYEGGSHFVSLTGNMTVTNLFVAASKDERMGSVYDQYLAGWRAHGGRLFVHYFNVGQNMSLGAFGALEYMDQTHSPKYDALMRYIDNNSCWWAGCAGSTLTYLPLVAR